MSETFPEATEHWHSFRVLFYHYHLSESLNGIIHSLLMHCDGMMWRVLNHYTVVRDNKWKSAKYKATHENKIMLRHKKKKYNFTAQFAVDEFWLKYVLTFIPPSIITHYKTNYYIELCIFMYFYVSIAQMCTTIDYYIWQLSKEPWVHVVDLLWMRVNFLIGPFYFLFFNS